MISSAALAFVALFVITSNWTLGDAALGAASGATMTTGLALLYMGYSSAPMAIVAPISSVLTGAIPVAVAAVSGKTPSALAWLGIVLGLAGIGLASYSPGESSGASTNVAAGLRLGVLSGVCFGIAFAIIAKTSDTSGASVVVVQRIVGFVGLTMYWFARKRDHPLIAPKGTARQFALVCGLIAGVALLALKLGYQRSSSAEDGQVAVAASQYATFAVIFAALLLRERPRPVATAGIVLSAIGVALMSLG